MARDKFHSEVRAALENEGWTITDDPLVLRSGNIQVQIDLGADKLIGAQKETEKIAVEIKSFTNQSFITAFYEAVGKFIVYRKALQLLNDERILFLAIPQDIYLEYEEELIIKSVLNDESIKIILYNQNDIIISQWIK